MVKALNDLILGEKLWMSLAFIGSGLLTVVARRWLAGMTAAEHAPGGILVMRLPTVLGFIVGAFVIILVLNGFWPTVLWVIQSNPSAPAVLALASAGVVTFSFVIVNHDARRADRVNSDDSMYVSQLQAFFVVWGFLFAFGGLASLVLVLLPILHL